MNRPLFHHLFQPFSIFVLWIQVTKFISIPEHYAVYARERGLIEASEKPDEKEEEADEEDVEEDMDEEGVDELVADSVDEEEAEGDLWPHC